MDDQLTVRVYRVLETGRTLLDKEDLMRALVQTYDDIVEYEDNNLEEISAKDAMFSVLLNVARLSPSKKTKALVSNSAKES